MKIPHPLLVEYQNLPKKSVCFVFPSRKDPGIPINNLRKTILVACAKAKVRSFTLKDLRHSFNTFLAEQGVSSKVRATLMGHTTTNMTDNVYTHATEKSLEEAMKKVLPG
ncbi:tyrosine-type recombinase/integrase [Candidatus Riflebacteria bacterium]